MKTAEVETFRDIRGYFLNNLKDTKPNGVNYLSYKKYKVIVEELEESNEVYQERLQQIYNESKFKVRLKVLQEAKKLGVKIIEDSKF